MSEREIINEQDAKLYAAFVNALHNAGKKASPEQIREFVKLAEAINHTSWLEPRIMAKILIEASPAQRSAIQELFLDLAEKSPEELQSLSGRSIEEILDGTAKNDVIETQGTSIADLLNNSGYSTGDEFFEFDAETFQPKQVKADDFEEQDRPKAMKANCDPNCSCSNPRTEITTSLDGKRKAWSMCDDCGRELGSIPLGAKMNSELAEMIELHKRLDVLEGAFEERDVELEAGPFQGKSLEEAIETGPFTGRSLESIFGEADA